jgi:ATP-dependent Clp protease adaptor protein ClpS
MIYNTTKTQEFAELDVVTEDSKLYTITLYNDDVNSFEWVIECLTKYCGHDFIQAEQCATLVHYKGKCIVKSGSLDKLKPICEVLLEKGLSAEIN